MKIKWFVNEMHACGVVRAEVIARELNGGSRYRVDCKMNLMYSDFAGTDLMVFQRQLTPAVLESMREAQKKGIRCIYDVDDDLFNTPVELGKAAEYYARPDVRDTITKFMCEADAVVVSTPALGEALAKRCPDAAKFIVRNSLDVPMWEEAYALRQVRARSEEVTIGWMASGSHVIDAPIVMPALARIMGEHPEVRLHFIGAMKGEQLSEELAVYKDRIKLGGWVEISVLPFAMVDFDIGIAPLKDIPWNRSKSGIKVLQYWALGLPAVATALPAYDVVESGLNGELVGSPEDWYGALKRLVEDSELRRLLGARGRLKLLQKHDMRRNVSEWVDVFDVVMSMK